MLSPGCAPPLSRILAVRMILGAVAVAVMLTGITLAKYLFDAPYLRRETLELQASAIAQALADKRDPARLPQFRHYTGSYGFRVFDHRLAQDRRMIAQANAALLPPLPTDPRGNAANLEETFEAFAAPRAGAPQRWQLTEREQTRGAQHYWVQTAMVGDPGWLWEAVVGGEMMDHVVIPALTIVPVLTLVMFLTMRSALRPLSRALRAGPTGRHRGHRRAHPRPIGHGRGTAGDRSRGGRTERHARPARTLACGAEAVHRGRRA